MTWQEQLREIWGNLDLASVFLTPQGQWACRVTYATQEGSRSFAYGGATVEEAVAGAYARWMKETGVPV